MGAACIVTVMERSGSIRAGSDWRPSLPMIAVCVGALLPWGRAPQSGIVDTGKYALVLALAGLAVYAFAAAHQLDLRWWRLASVPLALGCLWVGLIALNGYGALGPIVAASASVAWLLTARRAT
ncbi:MAG: hypothetical protein C5B48_11500 [Candidatus Rokuibacteriota bacterium]|nr:MAG: hypothetical protein C5B48_11500 [Candidatus Rokubacteria bacterium]